MSKSIKIERILDDDALKALLDAMSGLMQEEGDLTADGFRKLKLSVKQEFGQAIAKLKVSLPRPEDEADDDNDCLSPGEELIKYSKLKKRMKSSFNVITTNLAEGRLPPEEAVASFLADSDMMVCYPGYGDEFYLDYTKLCRTFTKAWEARDINALKTAADALEQSKRECHDKYK